MQDTAKKVAHGLEDVVAAETELSEVDGEHGELIVAGYPAEELAETFCIEEVLWLLWHGGEPDDGDSREVTDSLGRRRVDAFERLQRAPASKLDDPMDALRASLALLESNGDAWEDALDVVAAIPVANALWWSKQTGEEPLPPDPDLSHAADYLRMVTGEQPSEAATGALNAYLATVSDHGLNASTFTARVIASTQSDLISSVVGAVGALKGPLHGGAPGPVLDMLDDIGAPENAERWIRDELEAGRRIMGMGHRVYRVRDPRAAVFESALSRLEASDETSQRVELARAVEETAERVLAEKHPDRDLRANVEFYTAVLLEAVGLPRELFTNTFAAGRAAGWAAHVREQYDAAKLIRPRSVYTGPRRD